MDGWLFFVLEFFLGFLVWLVEFGGVGGRTLVGVRGRVRGWVVGSVVGLASYLLVGFRVL